MITHPSAQEILRAVMQWIEDLRPHLDERNAFLARVATHALATVERELTLGPPAHAAAAARLAQFLRQEGDYATLTHALCDKLRAGELNLSTPGLLELLRDNTAAQLTIDQPGYKHHT